MKWPWHINWVDDTYRGRDAIPSLENRLNDLSLLSLFLLISAQVTRAWMKGECVCVFVCSHAKTLWDALSLCHKWAKLWLHSNPGNKAVSKLCVACHPMFCELSRLVIRFIDLLLCTTFLVASSCSSLFRQQTGWWWQLNKTCTRLQSTIISSRGKDSFTNCRILSHLSTKHSNSILICTWLQSM